ncbi:MAG: hypothetical protein IKZ06_02055 [Oscillospiraceae bacterium]|nr:hypothetical protein [Oscillospiraceae bacterium]
MKKIVIVLMAIVLVLSGCRESSVYEEPVGGNCLPWSDMSNENNERPVIFVNGTLYYYDDYIGIIAIPENYTEAGNIIPVSDKIPENDFEILCKDKFSGKVFVGDETNTTVYITLDGNEKYCIRFVCEGMITEPNRVGHDSFVCYGGDLYEISFQKGEEFTLEELPEDFVPAGKLKYIKIDNFPQNDFETNCRYDAFGNSVDGKEVFINPDDLSEIYVATLYSWREGSYTIYTKCVLCE